MPFKSHIHWCKNEYKWVVHSFDGCKSPYIVDECSSCAIDNIMRCLNAIQTS